MRVSHPASFFTALPLSTAGKVFSIHERAEEPGLQAGKGVVKAVQTPPGCWEMLVALFVTASQDFSYDPHPVMSVGGKRNQQTGFR